jgi:histidinol dehydrogenase
MNVIDWSSLSSDERRARLRRPSIVSDGERRARVSEIIAAVRARGDEAVRDYTKRFDGVDVPRLTIPLSELERAWTDIDAETKAALMSAAARIRAFHAAQTPQAVAVETSPGVLCERRFFPLETVGLYAPGGTAPLVSTILMVGIPAQLAGCKNQVLATPPGPDGSIDIRLLAAAKLAGMTQVVCAGGAQAIAAMAYGTQTVLKADKIFGPGNSWVAEAKRQVAEDADGAAIDLPAGPSEVFIIADDSANAAFVASDLLAQAEHGPDSQVILATPSKTFISAVALEVEKQLSTLPREKIARTALANSLAILTSDLAQALEISEAYAPEHLILQTREDEALSARIRKAGAVFLGPWSPEAAGDYASGPNHVLPTGGAARSYGGLGLESFLRPVTFQRLSRSGLQAVASDVATLSRIERLDAHGRSVTVRNA